MPRKPDPLKVAFIEGAKHGITQKIYEDYPDAGMDLAPIDDTTFRIRVPGPNGPRYFVMTVKEQY